MGELRSFISLLLMLGLAFGVILGLVAPRRVPGILARILLLPLLVVFLLSVAVQVFHQASPVMQLGLILIVGPVVFAVLLRIVLGKALFTHILGALIYDFLKATFLSAWGAAAAILRLMFRRQPRRLHRRARRGQRRRLY